LDNQFAEGKKIVDKINKRVGEKQESKGGEKKKVSRSIPGGVRLVRKGAFSILYLVRRGTPEGKMIKRRHSKEKRRERKGCK